MATIGDILDNFFSPVSYEKLWVMQENDHYTKMVRKWQPVINAVNRAKNSVSSDCNNWQASHATTPTWKPGKTDPPLVDPRAHRIWVASPPGTDPATCKKAFIIYVSTKAAGKLANPFYPLNPGIQTDALYYGSIGSFGLYTTVDTIDCASKTAIMNFWMYNAMDKKSFGRFADDPVFIACGMKRQYMWWNWKEALNWSSGKIVSTPVPETSSW